MREQLTFNPRGEMIFCCDTTESGAITGSLRDHSFAELVKLWLKQSNDLQSARTERIAAFGLSALQAILVGQANWLRIIGGVFLIYLGAKTFLSKLAGQAAQASRGGVFGAYLSTFLLTLTNPMTILSFIAIFAGLQISTANAGYLSPILLVAGVFCGSAAWWLTLSFLVGQVRGLLEAGRMVWVNRISGVVILSFGIAALLIKTTGI